MLRSGKLYGVDEVKQAKALAALANKENAGDNGLLTPPPSDTAGSNPPSPNSDFDPLDLTRDTWGRTKAERRQEPSCKDHQWASPITSPQGSPAKPPPRMALAPR